MRLFIAGGNPEFRGTALIPVLDAAAGKKRITLLAHSKACPVAGHIEQWAWGKGILYGCLSAPTPEVFWGMVDSVIALPGTPPALLASAKEFNKPVWEPFKHAENNTSAGTAE